MKKFAKMSLVAAVAVAGMTNVNAASLEEAIKGVDVSGQFRYRFQEASDKTGTGNAGSDVEVEVGVKVPVNDNVTAVFKIDNANDDTDSVTKGGVTIEDYYFSYVNGAVTVNAGQQNIPGRMTDGAQGDGIVALYNLGSYTLGAAAFATNSVSDGSAKTTNGKDYRLDIDDKNVTSVIAMGSVGPVSFLAQYADVEDTLDAYNLKADSAVAGVKVGAEYTEVELDGTPSDEYSTVKAYASTKIGMVSTKVTYAKTGDQGSGSIDSFAGDAKTSGFSTETPSEFLLWNLGTAGQADMEVIALDASIALTDKISLRAAYADGEIGTGTEKDVNETLGQISYKMSSNLNTYVRYSSFDNSGSDDKDSERARIEVAYSF